MREKLNIRMIITPTFTAEDWDLYTFTDRDGAEEAARELNRALSESVFQQKSQPELLRAVSAVMEAYADVGAFDTEPRRLLNRIALEIFGGLR